MKTLDKIIYFFIEKVSPFLIVILGTYVGYLFGLVLSLEIVGSLIGFCLFGIIGRFMYKD